MCKALICIFVELADTDRAVGHPNREGIAEELRDKL